MASLAFGAIGGLIGGPVGWLIGSFIGNLLFPQKVDGPRLSDLHLQTSSYGGMTPIIYGTMRVAGNIDWQTDLTEHQSTSGGKGGPEVTTYTYSASFGVTLCEGPIKGVRKIWANGRKIYDRDAGIGDDLPITVYLGGEDQLPDPTMEAALGVGNVPAYRGLARVVFTDWFLTDYSNTIPNLNFEIFTNAGSIPWRVSSFSTPTASVGGATYDAGTGDITIGYYTSANYSESTFDLLTGASGGTTTAATDPIYEIEDGNPYDQNGDQRANVGAHTAIQGHLGFGYTHQAYYQGAATAPGIGGLDGGIALEYDYRGLFQNGYTYMIDLVPLTGLYLERWPSDPASGAITSAAPDVSYYLGSDNPGTIVLGSSDTGDVWAYCTGRTGSQVGLYRFDRDLALVDSWLKSDVPSFQGPFVIYNGMLAVTAASGTSPQRASVFDLSTLGSTNTLIGSLQLDAGLVAYGLARLSGGYCLTTSGVISLDPPVEDVTLASIVSDLSVRSGLSTSDIDVTELTDVVAGYGITAQRATRESVDELRQGYFFDAVEVDGKVDFVKRGGDSAAAIADDDLAAHDAADSAPPTLSTVRTPEFDLPQFISLNYVNAAADYQTGTQQSQRQVTLSQSKVTLDLQISLSDAEAKAIVERHLYEAWLERNQHSIYVPRKYARVVPTDVVTVQGKAIHVRAKSETRGGVIKLDGVPSLGQVIQQTLKSVPGSGFTPSTPGGGGAGAPSSSIATTAYLMDLPLIDDADEPNGFYVGMAGAAAGWPGAALYKSSDGGSSYGSIFSESTAQTIGTTSTALGAYLGGNTFDELNSVTVVLTSGELASATELAVLNGANEAVLGAEIIQFKNATLTATDTYTLTGLLRGRRGTEWAMTHASGERFVLMPAGRANSPASDLFLSRKYKPVTFGGTVSSATAQDFTSAGVALKPYAPVLLGGGVSPSGDVTLNWLRRTRVGGEWQPFVDAALSEASEEYVVQIWNATYSQCARIILVDSATTTTYTSAQQVADFGADQQIIYFTVSQLGALGPGTTARGTAPGDGASDNDPLSPIVPYGSPPVAPDELMMSLTWASQTAHSSLAGAFACSSLLEVAFTTPAALHDVTDPSELGSISLAAFGGGPVTRVACLSSVAGDLTGSDLGANSRVVAPSPIIYFSVGTNPYGYPELAPGTTYYINVKNDDGYGLCTCLSADCILSIDFLVPSGLVSTVTWNPADAGGATLSNGNLTAVLAGNFCRSTTSHSSGKYYFEIVVDAEDVGFNAPGFGVADARSNSGQGSWGQPGRSAYFATGLPNAWTAGPISLGVNMAVSDVWGVAVDIDAGKIWFRRNGTWVLSGDPAGGTNESGTFTTGVTYFIAARGANGGVTARFSSTAWSSSAPSGFVQW